MAAPACGFLLDGKPCPYEAAGMAEVAELAVGHYVPACVTCMVGRRAILSDEAHLKVYGYEVPSKEDEGEVKV